MPDREKTIKGLEELYGFLFKEYANIPAEESKIYYERTCAIRDALALLKEQEVVRCKDCKQSGIDSTSYPQYWCSAHTEYHDADWFCADGERKSADEKLMEEMDADPLG